MDRGGDRRLVDEHACVLLVVGELSAHELERDGLREPSALGLGRPDVRHAAGGERREQAITPYQTAGGEASVRFTLHGGASDVHLNDLADDLDDLEEAAGDRRIRSVGEVSGSKKLPSFFARLPDCSRSWAMIPLRVY